MATVEEKIILGIETSCDDTSLALLSGPEGAGSRTPTILGHKSFSQELILRKWGGVVPELAARNHLMKLAPLFEELLKEAKITPSQIDCIGVTTHPGLLGPLLTGINVAKTLSLLHKLPINPVNHLFAHLEAIFLTQPLPYPYLGLLISGGHSAFFLVKSPLDFQYLGGTTDDAAGEAFDKAGKILGIGYPAGKAIDDLAQKGDSTRFPFPIGLKNVEGPILSFSGLKTSFKNMLDQDPSLVCHTTEDQHRPVIADLCASYQMAIITALRLKTEAAYRILASDKSLPAKKIPLVVGGGVASNRGLRQIFNSHFPHCSFVPLQFCVDNGAMIANYALRTPQNNRPYPESLALDATSTYIQKSVKP
ncbi:MAG: tRNA (adenosine(37)-N6)-threonylcarbamoyltransferase complex transferase subunit TsaD [Bdellovibrionales bacterium GWA2_49_15]|nr:MAG: tRNA (adenosine(37)-N6)-threonylcarbamoyltransferase complex transferase subunit TsaD [Bdellovibrionales bacterium GWA2_49_15]HAZ14391.1 tRNA (adenosine(37)-N6)-threonylcarbamoyltransferase complex transferase subunit TsaD [Bdellovibrionales bacterium]